jgi:hypothetical protein
MIERDFERRARMQRRACGASFGRYAFWFTGAALALAALGWLLQLVGLAP